MRTAWNFRAPGQLVFGRGAVAQLGLLVARRKCKRLFLVSDERLNAAGVVERVLAPLKEANITVEAYLGGEPEPALSTSLAAAAIWTWQKWSQCF